MFYRWLFLLFRFPVFSAVSSAAIALGATPNQILYPVDSGSRGTEIINTFAFFSSAIASTATYPYVALQTTLPGSSPYTTYKYISNGIISYVQNIYSTTYNTLVIVKYLPPSTSKQQGIPQYVVLPPEQVTTLLYFTFPTLPLSAAPFSAGVVNGTLPFYSVDPARRAADIYSAVTQLMTTFKNTANNSQVYIQTTLSGPYNPPLPTPGLLQNVQSISYNNSLLQITFQTTPQSIVQTLLVAPEQVQQIIYLRQYGIP